MNRGAMTTPAQDGRRKKIQLRTYQKGKKVYQKNKVLNTRGKRI